MTDDGEELAVARVGSLRQLARSCRLFGGLARRVHPDAFKFPARVCTVKRTPPLNCTSSTGIKKLVRTCDERLSGYCGAVSLELPVLTRLWFAWVSFFRVLSDGAFARAVWDASLGVLPTTAAPAPLLPSPPAAPRDDAALELLALLQREGRLVDFLEQDIATFSDADVGAAARVVHEGTRKALRGHATLAPLRAEDEGARVTIAAGTSPDEVKLTGNVQGSPPFTGTLRHRGWRVSELRLPRAVREHDASILAPAEIEL
jgi:hypothetical protein